LVKTRQVIGIGDVSQNVRAVPASLLDQGYRLATIFLAAAGHRHVSAALRKREGSRAADAGPAAGHENCLARKGGGHRPAFFST
jgi:hypothetical protein